jgi:hypothetical protein
MIDVCIVKSCPITIIALTKIVLHSSLDYKPKAGPNEDES